MPKTKEKANGKKVRGRAAKQKRSFFKYSEEKLILALHEIRENNLKVREASRLYDVPRSTIQDHLKGKVPKISRKTGPEPLLTNAVETKIIEWVLNMAKCGFPIKKCDLIDTVECIIKDFKKQHLFKNGRPGERWYANFLRRHPEISLREAETINKARAVVTEESIRLWFRELNNFLNDHNYQGIFDDPSRVFNGDESGFSMCPKTGKVLAPRGWKNLYQIKTGQEKENITVLIVFNASGSVCPPLVIFPYLRPPRQLVDAMPENWVLGRSDSGWMKSDVFYEYIANDFNKWLLANNIRKPVILFIDGHRSHMTMAVSEFCEQNGIILYGLPPNTTHILQPADVSVFKPMKTEWKTTVRKWQSRSENINSSITKLNFCRVFQECLGNITMTTYIINGFRKCGLFPLNPDNVDYTKCVRNTLEKQTTEHAQDLAEPLSSDDIKSSKKVLETIRDKLVSYGVNVDVIIEEIRILELTLTSSIEKTLPNNTVVTQTSEVDLSQYNNADTMTGSYVSMDNLSIIPIEEVICVPVNDKSDSKEFNIMSNEIMPETLPLTSHNEKKTHTELNVHSPEVIIKIIPSTSHNEKETDATFTVEYPETTPEKQPSTSHNEKETDTEFNLEPPEIVPERPPSTHNKTETNTKFNLEAPEILRPDKLPSTSDNKTETDTRFNLEAPEIIRPDSLPSTSDNKTKTDTEFNLEAPQITPETLSSTSHDEMEAVTQNRSRGKIIQETPFVRHLIYPEPVSYKKKILNDKDKLPSAISCVAWRRHYEEKESVKRKKAEEIEKRKQIRTSVKKLQLEKRKKNNPKARQNAQQGENRRHSKKGDSVKVQDIGESVNNQKTKCVTCNEDLESDTEIDEEKNIGCDKCTNWFHLRCTEFLGMPYTEAALKDYICFRCS